MRPYPFESSGISSASTTLILLAMWGVPVASKWLLQRNEGATATPWNALVPQQLIPTPVDNTLECFNNSLLTKTLESEHASGHSKVCYHKTQNLTVRGCMCPRKHHILELQFVHFCLFNIMIVYPRKRLADKTHGLYNECQQQFLRSKTLIQSSYSTAVLYIGIMKVWGFWPEIITLKPA